MCFSILKQCNRSQDWLFLPRSTEVGHTFIVCWTKTARQTDRTRKQIQMSTPPSLSVNLILLNLFKGGCFALHFEVFFALLDILRSSWSSFQSSFSYTFRGVCESTGDSIRIALGTPFSCPVRGAVYRDALILDHYDCDYNDEINRLFGVCASLSSYEINPPTRPDISGWTSMLGLCVKLEVTSLRSQEHIRHQL